MNKRLSKLVSIALVATIVLSAMPIFMPRAHAITPPAFFVTPDSSFNTGSSGIGTWFIETLNLVTSGDIFTYQYEVDYDSSQITCTSAAYTAGATSQFMTSHTTVATGPVLSPGVISGGETLLGADVRPAGSGTIITMNFTIIQAPTLSNTPLTSLITLNPANTYLLDPSLSTVPNLEIDPAHYSFAYQLPTSVPYMNVVNFSPGPVFNQFNLWTGTPFTAHVTIFNLDGGYFPHTGAARLTFNDTLLGLTNVAFDPLWTGPNAFTYTHIGPNQGALDLTFSNPASNWTGVATKDIAVVTFTILNQGVVPPEAFGSFDISLMKLSNMALVSYYGTIGSIPVGPQPTPIPEVDVYAYLTAAPPYLTVDGGYLVGPTPSLGSLFNVTVSIHGVVQGVHKLIGVQYRLQFDSTVITPVMSYEGPYFPGWAAAEPGSLGTFFYDTPEIPDGVWGPHDLVGHMIFPNGTGMWNAPLPDGDGVITIITFKVLSQSFGEAGTFSPLTIADQLAIGLDDLVHQDIVPVTLSPPVNGNVTISNSWYTNPLNATWGARFIDVYGGAVNSGLVHLDTQYYRQFYPPYGGQGLNQPMDLVEPQSWVYLNANVTYNYWPVQSKNVAFEVDMPNGTVYTKLSAISDSNGVASTGFRMPWPCVNPSSLFGSDPEDAFWKVTATVELADIIINDTMAYHYDYLMHIFKVTTDAFQYNHGDCVGIYIDYGSLAGQTYPALLLVQVVDNLGVTVGTAVVQTTIGGAWTQGNIEAYKNFTAFVNIPVPKWAYAGIATIKVDAFNVEPAEGGVAITPEYVGPTIAIQPY